MDSRGKGFNSIIAAPVLVATPQIVDGLYYLWCSYQNWGGNTAFSV